MNDEHRALVEWLHECNSCGNTGIVGARKCSFCLRYREAADLIESLLNTKKTLSLQAAGLQARVEELEDECVQLKQGYTAARNDMARSCRRADELCREYKYEWESALERARCSEQLWTDAQARVEELEDRELGDCSEYQAAVEWMGGEMSIALQRANESENQRDAAEKRAGELEKAWHEDGMALGAALKKVEELELSKKELHDDLVMMMHQRNDAVEKLKAVMIEATNRPLDTTVAIARAAGYALCEKCRGIGFNRDHDYPEDCPKCDGLGWTRESK